VPAPLRTCPGCGFENAPADADCPLCGASASFQATVAETEAPTLVAGQVPGAPAGGLVGHAVAGRFRVDKLLGRGGMGEVYEALDQSNGQAVALKTMRAASEEEDAGREGRFRREIAALERIDHPVVPRVLAHGVEAGMPWYATELVRGLDLRQIVRESGPLDLERALWLGQEVARGLAAAHDRGVLHRDVKPANIMWSESGEIRLLDFGLARGEGEDLATLTRTGLVVGTPGYMSPEQFEGRALDGRSDLYSLGVVLYEALTGKLPFQAPTPLAMALKHKTEAPPAPRLLRPELPPWLDRVVLSCLQKDPAKRPASAAALAAELSRSHAGPQRRKLPSGDWVIEDDAPDWSLVLATTGERAHWTPGLALRFEERYHKLAAVTPPPGPGARWTYRFTPWPEGEVFRRLLDYEEDSAERRR
jgi:serine/threonine protein kinase